MDLIWTQDIGIWMLTSWKRCVFRAKRAKGKDAAKAGNNRCEYVATSLFFTQSRRRCECDCEATRRSRRLVNKVETYYFKNRPEGHQKVPFEWPLVALQGAILALYWKFGHVLDETEDEMRRTTNRPAGNAAGKNSYPRGCSVNEEPTWSGLHSVCFIRDTVELLLLMSLKIYLNFD